MKNILRYINANKSAFLCGAACLILLLEPLVKRGGPGRYIMVLMYLMILMFGPYLLTGNRKLLWLTLIVGIPGIISRVVLTLGISSDQYFIFGGLLILFTVVLASASVYYTCILSTRSSEAIFGTILTYLFLGICFAEIYTLIYSVNPKSFVAPAGNSREDIMGMFLYYSYVTLTTLGYGDLTPVSDLARRLASLEAIIGVLYVAVFIGRIIAMMHKEEEQEVEQEKKRKAPLRGRFKNRSTLLVRKKTMCKLK